MSDNKRPIHSWWRMTAKEFRQLGLLQEVNRQFLHPMGLALEVVRDTDTGEEWFGQVWDFRDDKEGMKFMEDEIELEKVERAKRMFEAKRPAREASLGEHIQQPKEEHDG